MSTACPASGEAKTATHRTPGHGSRPGCREEPAVAGVGDASIAAWPTARWSGVLRLPPGQVVAVVAGDDEVGAVAADRMGDVAAQRGAVLDRAVGVVEELHDVDPDDPGRRPLLGLAQRPALGGRRSCRCRPHPGGQQVGDGAALGGPPGDGTGRAELEVVGVGDDGEGARPVVGKGS